MTFSPEARVVVAVAERTETAAYTSPEQVSHGLWCDIFINSDITGTDSTYEVEAYDQGSQTWYTAAAALTITGDGTDTIRMGPTLTDAAGIYGGIAPKRWRLQVAGTNTSNTFSATATYHS